MEQGQKYSLENNIQTLEEENRHLRNVTENSADILALHDVEGRYIFITLASKKILGYEPAELIGKLLYDFIHAEDREQVIDFYETILGSLASVTFKYRFKHKKGHYAWVESTLTTNRNAETGEILQIVSITRDVTERKVLELRSEKYQSHLEYVVNERNFELEHLNEKLKLANDELYQINTELAKYKDHLENLVEKRTEELQQTADELKHSQQIIQFIEEGISHSYGNKFFEQIVLNISAVLNADYVYVAELGNQEEKAVQTIALCKHNRIIENISYALKSTPCENVADNVLYMCNSDVRNKFPDDELLAEMNIEGYIGVPLTDSSLNTVGIMVALFQKEIRSPELNKSIFQIFSGRVGLEIERRNIEKKLQENEQKYRLLFENMEAGFAIIEMIFDDNEVPTDYRLVEINPAFTKLTGFRPEIVGKKATEALSPNELENLKIYGNVVKTGTPAQFETFSKTVNKYFEIYAYRPKPGFLAIIMNDISERKGIEKRVLETIIQTEEKEKEKFANNLHDEVGPLLSSLNIYFSSLSETKDPEKTKFLHSQIRNLTAEVISAIRSISNDLSPNILTNFGLQKTIESIIHNKADLADIKFNSNLGSRRLTQNIEIILYRISRELINNTIKHSSSKLANLEINYSESQLIFNYNDPGGGFNINQTLSEPSGRLGLVGIINRVRSINGIYNMNSQKVKGFTFELIVPLL